MVKWSEIQRMLRLLKTELFEMITASAGLAYFGSSKKVAASERSQAGKVRIESA